MKIMMKIFIVYFIIANLMSFTVYSRELDYLKENLKSLGVPDEYSQNILNYINNSDFSSEELNEVIDKSEEVFNDITEKSQDGFTVSEIFSIYNEANNLADNLNIDVDIDIINQEVILKDKSTNAVLFKCNKDDAKRYYSNYQQLKLEGINYEDILSYINEDSEKINIEDYINKEAEDYINEENKRFNAEEYINEESIENYNNNTLNKEDNSKDILSKEIINENANKYNTNNANNHNTNGNNKEMLSEKIQRKLNESRDRRVQGGVAIVLIGSTILAIILGIIAHKEV